MTSSEFRQLCDEHVGFVYRVLQRHGLSARDLEDGCQEVFLTVFRRSSTFEGRSSLRTWIYGIAVRVAIGMRRKAFRRREVLMEVPETATGPEPYEAMVRDEGRALLTAALAALPRPKREVFVLYELEELTMAEVAAMLNVPENTALSRLYSAREEIAAFVRRSELLAANRPKKDGIMSERRDPPRWKDGGHHAHHEWPEGFREALAAYPAAGPSSEARARIVKRLEAEVIAQPAANSGAHRSAWWAAAGGAVTLAIAGWFTLGQIARPVPAARPPSPAPRASVPKQERALPPKLEPNPNVPPDVPAQTAARARPGPQRRAATPSMPPTAATAPAARAELELLIRARSVVGSAPAQALELVNEHAARYPMSTFGEEREVLAIQAERRLGRKTSAASRTHRFLRDHPNSVHRQALESLVSH